MEPLQSIPVLEDESDSIQIFLKNVRVIYPSLLTTATAINLRQKYKLKIPDAIIAAEAINNKMTFITADKEIIRKIREIEVIDPN
ncbi:MAG: PIN domain-containing protein [Brevinematales bacterium]